MTAKHETVCITRCGFNFLHSEGAEFAAKVTSLVYGQGIYDPRTGVKQVMLIPLLGRW